MKTKSLLKLHYYCLFNKTNMLVLTFCLLLILILNIYTWVLNINQLLSIDTIISLVWNSVFTYNKIFIILFGIFLVGNFCLPDNDNYKSLFIIDNLSTTKFYLTKFLTISITLLFFVLMIFIGFIITSMLFSQNFIFSLKYLLAFLSLYLLSLTYGYLTAIIIKFIPSIFIIIIVFIIYLSKDYINGNEILNTFFPTIMVDNLEIINIFSNIIIILFYFTITLIISIKRN